MLTAICIALGCALVPARADWPGKTHRVKVKTLVSLMLIDGGSVEGIKGFQDTWVKPNSIKEVFWFTVTHSCCSTQNKQCCFIPD